MASTFVTFANPLVTSLLGTSLPSLSNRRLTGSGRISSKVCAIAKKLEPTKKSAGGVLLPKSAVKFERYLMGEILSIGAEAGGLEAGKKVGLSMLDCVLYVVLFSDINAYEVDMGTDAKHCFCKAGDLLAVVE
ncbi:hypothetical protein RJ639_043869 [Escallonia herrerae]|uniref:Uncharacterized protein n=1 Tax=Escallonia herrerae TaxID=1293975 RepID=A0AA88WG16_9ASTE|nr:hypothetical protein RJ639_043869 [Escallonia herrerae]